MNVPHFPHGRRTTDAPSCRCVCHAAVLVDSRGVVVHTQPLTVPVDANRMSWKPDAASLAEAVEDHVTRVMVGALTACAGCSGRHLTGTGVVVRRTFPAWARFDGFQSPKRADEGEGWEA